MSSNYNLQAFTHGSVSADETHALVEYQGTWYDWDFAFVEGAGDGVLWERGTNDWKITKTSNGFKAEKTNGFSTADTFQPDSNGIVTISFSWNDHTGLKFKPPVISSGGGGTSTEGVNAPYVTWNFPQRVCGQNTYVSVTHTEATSSATTYTVHDSTGQIGTILVGTGSTASANFAFTISDRTLQVKNSAGAVIGSKVFTCGSKKKVHSNFW